MVNIPEIPYAELESIAVGAFALAFVLLHLGRSLLREVRPRRCVFCQQKIRAGDYEHHLEICGLTSLLGGQKPDMRKDQKS